MTVCPNCKEEYEPNPLEPHRLTCAGNEVKIAEYILRSTINVGDRFREEYKGIEELAESIRKFGLMQYPVIDQDNNLICGGRRLQAMDLLGWTNIPIVRKRNVDNLKLREMELEENIQRVNLTWQEDAKLRKAILDIKQKIYGVKSAGKSNSGISANDIATQMGESPSSFSADVRLAEAIELIPEIGNAKNKADAFKMMKQLYEKLLVDELDQRRLSAPDSLSSAVTKADSYFIIGDAITDLEQMTENQGWGFIDVDTPYAIDIMNLKKGDQENLLIEHDYKEWSPEDYVRDCTRVAKEVYRLSNPDAFMIWWFAIQWYQPLYQILTQCKVEKPEFSWDIRLIPGIWYAKGGCQTQAPERNLGSSYETFFICSKGKPSIFQRGRSNVFEYQKLQPDKKIHPTEKPIELYTDLLETFSTTSTKCYSAFLGSGVIIRAGLKTGRMVEGRDLNEEVKKRFLCKVQEEFPNANSTAVAVGSLD
jgi:ParB/RepB/Spo0J family partition protein